MNSTDLLKKIQPILFDQNSAKNIGSQIEASHYFLIELERLATEMEYDEVIKMTRMSILFEGFYQNINEDNVKKSLAVVRNLRWQKHFGVPTVTFLLSYKIQIDQTIQVFKKFSSSNQSLTNLPWFVNQDSDSIVDADNNVICNPYSVSSVQLPHAKEVMGIFTKTYNPLGGFTTAACDPVSQQFIEHAASISKEGGKVLEIGAAFGAASLEALGRGAKVFCNDIDSQNLAVVRNRFLQTLKDQETSVTGDSSQLVLVPGELPNDLGGLPKNFFNAILICRVLHFFTGDKIEESLALMSKLLSQSGKIYIVCETPYLKNWQRFIPEFNQRVTDGVKWPGEITTPAAYESSGRITSLPKFVHWITKEVLDRSLRNAGLIVEHSAYINRAGQFPDDLLLPEYGQESVGAIGVCRRQ